MQPEIRRPVYACGLGVADVGYVVDVLHGVHLAPDDSLSDQSCSSFARQEAFSADGEVAPFCAEDLAETGGVFDLRLAEAGTDTPPNALFGV